MRKTSTSADILLLAWVSTLFALQALRAFFSSVYYHNLEALGINATVLYVLLLGAPLVMMLMPEQRHAGRWIVIGALLLAGSRAALNVSWGSAAYLLVAGLACAGYFILLPALLGASGRAMRQGSALVALGMALAVAMDMALMVMGLSHDFTVRPMGALFAWPLAVLLAYLAWRVSHQIHGGESPVPAGGLRGAAVGLGAWLFLQLTAFGSAHHVARWNDAALAPVAVALLMGAALGGGGLAFGLRRPRHFVALLHGFAIAAVIDHTFVHSPLLPLLLVGLQAALVLQLPVLLSPIAAAPLGQGARLAALSGGILAGLTFVGVFAFTFAFIPLSGLWQGAERVLLPGAILLALVPAWRGHVRFEWPTAPPASVRAILLVLPLLVAASAAVAPEGPVPMAPDTSVLTVLSFNVHQGFNNDGVVDPDVFLRVLQEADADVIALQESDTSRISSAQLDIVAYLAARAGYHAHAGAPTSAQSFGVAILSRHPIVEASVIPLPSQSDHRNLLVVTLEVQGERVHVAAVHMGLDKEDRLAQVDAILTHVRALEGPRLLVGDFNSCPTGLCPEEGEPDDVYARVTQDHHDAWTAAGHARDDPAGHTYDARDPTERIDYVFASRDVTVLRAETLGTENALAASDHLPVRAVVALP